MRVVKIGTYQSFIEKRARAHFPTWEISLWFESCVIYYINLNISSRNLNDIKRDDFVSYNLQWFESCVIWQTAKMAEIGLVDKMSIRNFHPYAHAHEIQ